MDDFYPSIPSELEFDPKDLVAALRRKKIEGNLGPLDYSIGTKQLQAKIPVNDALVNALVKYNGDWNFQAQKPLWGGNLNFDANSNNGKKNFYLQFQRKF